MYLQHVLCLDPPGRYKQHGDTESADKLMKIIRQFLDREMVELDEELAACLPKSLADIPSDPGQLFQLGDDRRCLESGNGCGNGAELETAPRLDSYDG